MLLYIKYLKLIIILLIFLIMHGCTLRPIKLEIASSSRLNPDKHQQSLAVVVRAYLLTDDRLFRSASFQQLWRADVRTLADTLVAKQQWRQSVNQIKTLRFVRNPKAKYIALLALFRQPLISHWRLSKALNQDWYTPYQTLHIKLSGNSIKWLES